MKYFSFLAKKISLLELLLILIWIQIIDYIQFNGWVLGEEWFAILFLWLIPSILTWLLYELFLFILTKIEGKKGKKIKWRFLYILFTIPLGYLVLYSTILIVYSSFVMNIMFMIKNIM